MECGKDVDLNELRAYKRLTDNKELTDLNKVQNPTSGDKLNPNKENQTDEPMEEDNSRSEATFSFKITDVNNFFNSKDNRLSEPCYVRNLPWKIMAMPRVTPDRQSKSLGFFLQCNGESDSLSWSCNASAELKLLSQAPAIQDMSRSIDHHFFPKEVCCGSLFRFRGFIRTKKSGLVRTYSPFSGPF